MSSKILAKDLIFNYISSVLMILFVGCGSSTQSVDLPRGESLDAELQVHGPEFFAIDGSLPQISSADVQSILFNEHGFLYSQIPSDITASNCETSIREPEIKGETAFYKVDLNGDGCVSHLQPETSKVIALELEVQCLSGEPFESPPHLVSGSALDLRFSPCSSDGSYKLRVSRKTHVLTQGEESETGFVHVTNLMTEDGGLCQIERNEGLTRVDNCSEFTKISEISRLNGEPSKSKVLAIRQLRSQALKGQESSLFYTSGRASVRVNNWQGSVDYSSKKPKFRLENADSDSSISDFVPEKISFEANSAKRVNLYLSKAR